MLNVRYGSGWSREQTACAARPSFSTSRLRNSSMPSSGVSRPPSTAFDKMRSRLADTGCSLRREPEFGREVVEPRHSGEFPRAEVVVDDGFEVAAAEPRVEAQTRRLPLRDGPGRGQSGFFRPLERGFG